MKCRCVGRIVRETTISSNRQTSEEEALTKPVNNVCNFNDYEDETYNGNNGQTSEEETLTKPVNNVCILNGRTRMKHTMAIELEVDKQDCANSL
jgi:hypothetical protein